jgi:hypothetical protein
MHKKANRHARAGLCGGLPHSFGESVFKTKPRMIRTEKPTLNKIEESECEDLSEAPEAIIIFLVGDLNSNPHCDYSRGYAPGGEGTLVGRSRFWLSGRGAELLLKLLEVYDVYTHNFDTNFNRTRCFS